METYFSIIYLECYEISSTILFKTLYPYLSPLYTTSYDQGFQNDVDFSLVHGFKKPLILTT